MGRTSKPCSGCGRRAYRFRETGKVCGDCSLDLKYAKACKEKVQKATEGRYGLYRIPRAGSRTPSYYFKTLTHVSFTEKESNLGSVFNLLLQLIVAEHTEFIPPEGVYHQRSCGMAKKRYPGVDMSELDPYNTQGLLDLAKDEGELVIFRNDIADTIERLHKEIKASIINTAKVAGKAGTNLLLQLHDGDITLDDMNEKIEKMKGE